MRSSFSHRTQFRQTRHRTQRLLRMELLECRMVLHHATTLDIIGNPLAVGGYNKQMTYASFAGSQGAEVAAGATGTEGEPSSVSGQNNTQSSAQFLPHFGTGAGKDGAIDISGALGPLPPPVTPHEDDGSISLANPTNLIAGSTGRAFASGTIGDGPNGSAGTHHGDYDFYRVPALANQLLTIDVDAFGSTLDPVVGIYNSAGTLLALNDNASDNPYYGTILSSHLRFLVPAADTYAVVVFGSGSAPQADPFNSASGGGVASEGPYNLSILMESPVVLHPHEDDGSIPLATDAGLPLGPGGKAFTSGFIGDGPHGSAGSGTGDFDVYRVQAVAGQTITADLDSDADFPYGLDTIATIYDSAGHELIFADDDGQTFNTRISIAAPVTGTYYVLIGGFTVDTFETPDDPFDSASGPGVGAEGPYTLTLEVSSPQDVDYYSFDLAAGDIFGANMSGNGKRLELYRPDGTLLIGSSQHDLNGLKPTSSPLPSGGVANLAYVVSTPGRYALAVSTGVGAYSLQLRDFRPVLEQQPAYSHQILFLDFDGADVSIPETLPGTFAGGGNPDAHLSPLRSFLPRWGLTPADENRVIDSILAGVTDKLAHDVSGVVGHGLNGDFTVTGRAGDFQIEILNSRDNPDPWGLPNVSRVIVGGTLEQMGAPFFFTGISPSIDVGNFDTAETAFAPLDAVSDPVDPTAEFQATLNAVPLAPGASIVNLIGYYESYIIAHEAGHFFGNWHADSTSTNVMNATLFGEDTVGPDGLWGTADDLNLEFKTDIYRVSEGYKGIEDTLNTIAFGLSTGKQAGTYFDFVTGTLYVTGQIDNGHADKLQVKTVGANLQVSINGQLSLTRPAAGVNRVVLNGSGDSDELDASAYTAAVTLQGKGASDLLLGGSGDDVLLGGDGDDLLFGGAGNDVLVGGDGSDALDGGLGLDVLIGGRGSDILLGTSGGDLLIAGRTTFDNNVTALLAVLSEWDSSRTYEKRLANLRGTGSGPRSNGSYFLTTTGPQATVLDDSASDLLYGGSGRDWYFATRAGRNKDLILGLSNSESVDG